MSVGLTLQIASFVKSALGDNFKCPERTVSLLSQMLAALLTPFIPTGKVTAGKLVLGNRSDYLVYSFGPLDMA